jgi:hypothetical protein
LGLYCNPNPILKVLEFCRLSIISPSFLPFTPMSLLYHPDEYAFFSPSVPQLNQNLYLDKLAILWVRIWKTSVLLHLFPEVTHTTSCSGIAFPTHKLAAYKALKEGFLTLFFHSSEFLVIGHFSPFSHHVVKSHHKSCGPCIYWVLDQNKPQYQVSGSNCSMQSQFSNKLGLDQRLIQSQYLVLGLILIGSPINTNTGIGLATLLLLSSTRVASGKSQLWTPLVCFEMGWPRVRHCSNGFLWGSTYYSVFSNDYEYFQEEILSISGIEGVVY